MASRLFDMFFLDVANSLFKTSKTFWRRQELMKSAILALQATLIATRALRPTWTHSSRSTTSAMSQRERSSRKCRRTSNFRNYIQKKFRRVTLRYPRDFASIGKVARRTYNIGNFNLQLGLDFAVLGILHIHELEGSNALDTPRRPV